MCAVVLHRLAVFIPSGTSLTMVMTPLPGPRRNPGQQAKWACLACHTSAPRSGWRRSRTPPALATIVPVVTASDYHEGWAYQGGAFELGFNASWTLSNLAFATLVQRMKAGEQF